ncbi:uncharacterized protein LOC106166940 [Lingula anatina]|uniref:Uncharacterized protein LOC106166940 n=1 Tax=Lingula anatina TaxID=7574 RepID=A0A1S3IS67_LINAN|nr:uncharacterized protein LOC106166940 [Lingula anatina]|eukprot:XP_013401055.1 uncharacterized protein LOC106166940 [Lingula anatina]
MNMPLFYVTLLLTILVSMSEADRQPIPDADTDEDEDADTVITVPTPFPGTSTVKVPKTTEKGTRRLKLTFPSTPNRLCPGVPLTQRIVELRNVTVGNTTITMEPAAINGEITAFPSEICAWRIQKHYGDSVNIKGIGIYEKWQDSQKCINKANEDMTCVEQLREVPWLFQCLGGKCPEGYTGPALMMLKVPIPIACFCQLLPK